MEVEIIFHLWGQTVYITVTAGPMEQRENVCAYTTEKQLPLIGADSGVKKYGA
jgi:hypothetical protein